MITSLDQLDLSKKYTYADYLTWRFKERVELIKGHIFKMSPAPNRSHQSISLTIASALHVYLRGHNCKVYDAPFDVVLSKNDQSTVIQPDLCVIRDQVKLSKQGCTGAPDLIIEILSPGNAQREMKEKFELYEENGVQEYWIVSPSEQSVLIYNLKEGKYIGSKPFISGEKVGSQIVDGFDMDVQEIFAG